MMRFADELRGSEGERCTVTSPGSRQLRDGVVIAWDDAAGMATVECDDGTTFRVRFDFVQLHGDEKP